MAIFSQINHKSFSQQAFKTLLSTQMISLTAAPSTLLTELQTF